MTTAHGGTLVDRITSTPDALRAQAAGLLRVALDARELADLELIATGAASPLTGFVGAADYASILATTRLANGTVWPIPLTLAYDGATPGEQLALVDERDRLWGILHVTDVYARDTAAELEAVYGTRDPSHPGVAYILARPATLVGGTVDVLPLPQGLAFAEHRRSPRELRAEIAKRGWTRVSGFETVQPIHRAHEHLTKLALEITDGLVIHPLVGETKSDDVPASVRFSAYEILVENYYPPGRTILAALPGAMRHAGPKEALLHALLGKNYGIDSLIIGRDHAGIGDFYAPLAAHAIFDAFSDLGVTPLRFDATFFCRACDGCASSRTCPHDESERVELSGGKVREILKAGGQLPEEFTRPEVAEILRAHYTKNEIPVTTVVPTGGFIVWFTGLSGAGKSTLAALVAKELAHETRIEILDGDEVRTHLSKGLGFSKEDRDTNVQRIGFVARTLAAHGIGVITAAISPYADTRKAVRAQAEARGIAFVEVFANASLDALVARDVKGHYKRALAGEVTNFTGVSDPYEAPTAPDIEVRTDSESIEQSAAKIIGVLRARGLLSPLPTTTGAHGARPHTSS